MLASTNKAALVSHLKPKSPVTESFRTLRTNIRFCFVNGTPQTIVITSTLPSEGKTTIVSNLAVVYAQEGKRVLLIDADFRRPALHRIFARPNLEGLSTLLAGMSSLSETVFDTSIGNLSVLTSGPTPPNPAELLASSEMESLVKELRNLYDVILFDSPSALQIADTRLLAALCDGVVLVVGSGRAKRDQINETLAGVEQTGTRLLGIVLNNKRKRMKAFF